MKRLVYKELLKWKNNANHKPLIVNGARQVGKTWILNEFGKNEFKEVFAKVPSFILALPLRLK